jgi:hypothetical protein
MIDSSLQPSWIVKREQRKADAASRAERVAMQNRITELLMEKHSVPFCLDFLRGLQVNLECLSDISAHLKASATPDEGAQLYTVIMHSSAPPWSSITATIQFLKPQTDGIQILLWGKDAKYIRLAPLPTGDGIGAIVPDRAVPANATCLAELVAEEWANHICHE